MDSIDTPISPESYEVAVMAVGGVLSAIDGGYSIDGLVESIEAHILILN